MRAPFIEIEQCPEVGQIVAQRGESRDQIMPAIGAVDDHTLGPRAAEHVADRRPAQRRIDSDDDDAKMGGGEGVEQPRSAVDPRKAT
jgi:hypothetical protein